METGENFKTMEVFDPWASHIFSGKKTVELRKNDPKNWGATKKDDVLRIVKKGTDEVKLFMVEEVRTYKNLYAAFVAEGVRHLLPGKPDDVKASDIYLGFDGADSQPEKHDEKSFRSSERSSSS